MAEIQTRRVVLIGKAGNGKSATGNSILGEKLFGSKTSFTPSTLKCEKYTKFRSNAQRNYTVVDTPGLFDTDKSFAERALEIQRAIEICPKPHAFLIVMRADSRYTEEEKLTIDVLRVIFGEQFLKHAILVFTRGTDYTSDQALNNSIAACESIMNLKKECGNRVVRVENNPMINSTTREGLVNNVFDMIEQVSDDGKEFYLYKYLGVHRNCLQHRLKTRAPNAELEEELNELVDVLGRQLRYERWRSCLVGGGATAAVGLVLCAGVKIATRRF